METKEQKTNGGAVGAREPDAIYQKGKLVARVKEPEVDEAGKEVRFAQVIDNEGFMLPEECEFRNYRLQVRKVAYATKELSKSRERILRGVVAEIVGYREH